MVAKKGECLGHFYDAIQNSVEHMSESFYHELMSRGSTLIGAPFYRMTDPVFRLKHRAMTTPAPRPVKVAVIPTNCLRLGTGTPRTDMSSIMAREDAKTAGSSKQAGGRGAQSGGRGGRQSRRALANALLAQHEAQQAAGEAQQAALIAQQHNTAMITQQPSTTHTSTALSTPGQPVVAPNPS